MPRSDISTPESAKPVGGVDGWNPWPEDPRILTTVSPRGETRAQREARYMNHIMNEFIEQEPLPTTDGEALTNAHHIRFALQREGINTVRDLVSFPVADLVNLTLRTAWSDDFSAGVDHPL